MITRGKLPVASFVVLTLVVAACGDDDDPAGGGGGGSDGSGGESADVVTIGLVDDFSGAQSVIGQAAARGIEQRIAQVNAAGGIEALGGAELRVTRYDTETDPNTATAQATRAVEDEVDLIMGGSITDSAIAGTNVSSRADVPWIVTGAISTEITGRGLPNVFQIAPNTETFAQSIYDVMHWACDQLDCADNPTIGLSISDTTYGNDVSSAFEQADSEGYFDVVGEVSYPLSTTDLSSIAARMASGNPEVLFNAGYPNDGLQLGRIFGTTVDTNAKVFVSLATHEVVESELGADANGMIVYADVSNLFDGIPDSFVEQNEIYSEEHGEEMHYMAVRGYMAASMAIDALEQAGSTDGEALADALHEVEITHETGNLWPQDTVSFEEDGAVVGGHLLFVQIQDGEAVGVYPTELAKADLQAYR